MIYSIAPSELASYGFHSRPILFFEYSGARSDILSVQMRCAIAWGAKRFIGPKAERKTAILQNVRVLEGAEYAAECAKLSNTTSLS